ncbi:hypothetical protein ACSTJT_18800 [Vibrio parahaemolyticus]|nr:hypothetical protein [Vibrio parahaemolyticus]HCH1629642.1 hypothetical protein [Vibrio parahaemolyticus]
MAEFSTYVPYGLAFSLTVFFSWVLWSMLRDLGDFQRIWRFQRKIRKVLVTNKRELSIDDLKHLQQNSLITMPYLIYVLSKLKEELILSGENIEVKSRLDLYIQELLEDEPFETIPDRLKVHLAILEEETNNSEVFSHFVRDLKTELAQIDKEFKRMKWWTIIGTLSGIVGVILSLVN